MGVWGFSSRWFEVGFSSGMQTDLGEHGRKERAPQSSSTGEEQSVTVGAPGLVLGPCGASAVI